MLYEVITNPVVIAVCLMLLLSLLRINVVISLTLSALVGGLRITSYNVCYTKLLRDGIHLASSSVWLHMTKKEQACRPARTGLGSTRGQAQGGQPPRAFQRLTI